MNNIKHFKSINIDFLPEKKMMKQIKFECYILLRFQHIVA